MKKFSLIFTSLLMAFTACQTDKSEDTEVNSLSFTYEIDTVRIDSKEEFLFLNMGLYMSDYDPTADLLYNLNPETSRMEVIDLEKNELKELIQYDQDGPNAVKEMFTSGIKITDSGKKWFTDYYSIIHLNVFDEKIGTFRLNNENFAGDTLPNGFEIDGMGKITRSGKYFVSNYGDYRVDGIGLLGLAVIDLKSQTKKLHPIDVFKSLEKYEVSFSEGGKVRARIGEWNLISLSEDKIVHSNSAQNKFRVLDFITGQQEETVLKSQWLSDEKSSGYLKQASSMEEFDRIKDLKKQEVTFGPWIHDAEREYFWRISREKNGGTVENPDFSFVVTVLDKDLKQIGEIQLAEGESLPFDGLPSLSFFRDGMLYMFLNEEDEMAFVRFKPKFEN